MDDIVILEDRGTEQLPHLRPDCTIHIFQEGNKRKFCCKCYCFVCDTVVAQCSRWMEHCIANPKDSHWRALRSVYRAKKPTHSSVDAHKPSSIPNVDGIKIERGSSKNHSNGGNGTPNVFIDLTGDAPLLVNTTTQQKSLLLPPSSSVPVVHAAPPTSLNPTSSSSAPLHPPTTSTSNSVTSMTHSLAVPKPTSKSKSKSKTSDSSAVKKPRTFRAPSAYNMFMKEEIKKLKVANPSMAHNEVFKMAAGNWKSVRDAAANHHS